MKIQQIPPQNIYRVQGFYGPAYNLTFRGEAEDKFINSAAEGKIDESQINEYFSKNSTMGVLSKSGVKKLLLAFIQRLSGDENSIKTRKEELDKREKDLNTQKNELDSRETAVEARENQVTQKESNVEAERQSFDAERQSFEAERQKLETEMADRKQKLENEEQKLKERLDAYDELDALRRQDIRTELEQEYAGRENQLVQQEKELMERLAAADTLEELTLNEVSSKVRTLYKIEDNDVQIYENEGEQMVQVAKILNECKLRFENCTENTVTELTESMQDNNGNISVDMLKALENILKAKTYCYVDDLAKIIKAIKDDKGEIDSVKYGHCIALLSLPNSTYKSILDNMVSKFELSKDLLIPKADHHTISSEILEHINQGYTPYGTHWAKIVAMCDSNKNIKIEYIDPNTKENFIQIITALIAIAKKEKEMEYIYIGAKLKELNTRLESK